MYFQNHLLRGDTLRCLHVVIKVNCDWVASCEKFKVKEPYRSFELSRRFKQDPLRYCQKKNKKIRNKC
jgi:hypothetical protein